MVDSSVEKAPAKLDVTADVLVDLVKKVDELKTDFVPYVKLATDVTVVHRDELNRLTAKCAKLQKEIAGHKHAKESGEAMPPMETPQ